MYNAKKLERAMADFKAGKQKAFDVIYEQTYKLVYYIAYPIVGEKNAADNVSQETYIKLVRNIDNYQLNTAPKAWIAMIARNTALNYAKRAAREVAVTDRYLATVAAEPENRETPLIDLAQAVLSEDEFTIVMLCVTEGYTLREVAALFELSTSGVSWKLNNALEKLKKEAIARDVR